MRTASGGALLLTLLIVSVWPVFSQNAVHLLIPIGGGYSDIYQGWSQAILPRAVNGTVEILVMGMTYSSNAEKITPGEREVNIRDAEERRFQIEEACKRAAPAGVTCRARLVPVFTRADALDPANLAFFDGPVSAVFFLGGDQTVAMRVLANTPLEEALAKAYQNGAVVGGTSAGGGMMAKAMLAGYRLNFAAENATAFGSADVWNRQDLRGLSFGVADAVLDQHFFQRARLSRLLNAISQPGVPPVGIGIDAYTGVTIRDDRYVEGVFGLYNVTVLDAATYHAAEGVTYSAKDGRISLRNVLVHLLVPGSGGFDLQERVASNLPPADKLTRSYAGLALPAGSGPLILGGDLSGGLRDHPALVRFVELSGGKQARIAVVALGYASDSSARTAAEKYAAALSVPTELVILSTKDTQPANIFPEVTGILVIARDQSKIDAGRLERVKQAWLAGAPLLLDNAATALAGPDFAAHPPTPSDVEEQEKAVQRSFIQGRTVLKPGLSLLPVSFEPQIVNDNRWGRLFSLAYAHPERVAFGLAQGSAVILEASGARVVGGGEVYALDLRSASLGLGSNQGYAITNGLLDVYQPGDALSPVTADRNASVSRQPTPAIQWTVATATSTPQPTYTTAPTAEATQPPATATVPPSPTEASPQNPANPFPGWVLPAAGLGLLAGAGVLAWIGMRRRSLP